MCDAARKCSGRQLAATCAIAAVARCEPIGSSTISISRAAWATSRKRAALVIPPTRVILMFTASAASNARQSNRSRTVRIDSSTVTGQRERLRTSRISASVGQVCSTNVFSPPVYCKNSHAWATVQAPLGSEVTKSDASPAASSTARSRSAVRRRLRAELQLPAAIALAAHPRRLRGPSLGRVQSQRVERRVVALQHAAQQYRSRLPEQLPPQVPERDIDGRFVPSVHDLPQPVVPSSASTRTTIVVNAVSARPCDIV